MTSFLSHNERIAISQMSKVVLITGCSSGFGKHLAEEGLAAGLRVIATARKPESLSELGKQGCHTTQLDVTWDEERLAKFAEEAVAVYGQIDYLINNAGYLQSGAIEEFTHEANLKQFNTLFFGLVNTTCAFLPYFRKQRSGVIVNISSQGGTINVSGGGMYCAAKAAVDSVSDTWSKELADFDIGCFSVQPGAFATSVATDNNLIKAPKTIEGYNTPHEWAKMFNERAGHEQGDAKKAAKKIITVMQLEKLPLRLPLGEDAAKNIPRVLRENANEVEEYKEYSTGTDRD